MASTQPVDEEIIQAQDRFKNQLASITAQIHSRAINLELDAWLNQNMGPDTSIYRELKEACEQGVSKGWLCNREGGGIRYGRIFKPSEELHGFSVDVVLMENIAGPHHTHPTGEIDLIMPIDDEAEFDSRPAGWLVCPPGSAHKPTVTKGRALVLYLLPNGAIEFTQQ